jgi:serine/threonine protein kinase/Tfp pilus assembly protein PilF
MTESERHLMTIFSAALDRESEGERAAYLDEACKDNPGLRERVEALFRAHEQVGGFLERRGTVAFHSTSAAAEPANPLAGSTIAGRYKLIEEIGEGGMGTVWMAQQTEPVKRAVAVKLIKPGMDSKQVLARFEAERQALALMDHPNIAKVLDGGMTGEPAALATGGGRPYFVMELVKGVPITRYCDEHRLAPRQRLELFVPVCQAVQHAHQKGIIHRDIKPSNILVAQYDGRPVPKVIDFGVAKAAGHQLTDKTLLTGFGAVVGTLEYMSPEQAELNQLDIDTRSDIYSLGVVLYELLTGSTPLDKKRLKQAAFAEVLRIIREEEPPKPSTRLSGSKDSLPSISAQRHTEPAKLTKLVRGELDWIVMKALEKDRNRRYETANGFAMDVQRYLADEPVQACPPSAGYRLRKFARRNRPALFIATAVSAALLFGVVGLLIANYQITQQRNLATEQRDLAQREHQQSEANLQKARKAVDDYFTLVSANPIFDTPGLETLRKQLLETALAYYQGFVKEHGDDPMLLADMAAANIRVAQIIYLNGGSSGRYFPPQRDGVDAIERLIAEGRDTPEVQRRLTPLWLGGFADLDPNEVIIRVDMKEVSRYLRKEIKIWEKFVNDNPGAPEFQNDLAGMCLYLSANEDGERMRLSDRAIEIWQKLAKENPKASSYRLDLARTYEARAQWLRGAGRGPEADQDLEKALLLRRELARDFPERGQHSGWLATSYRTQAEMQSARGQPKEAEKTLRQALAIQEKLVADFPAAHTHQDELARTQLALAAVLNKLGRSQDAQAAYRQALGGFEQLVVAFPKAAHYQTQLVQTAKDFAQLLEASGQPQKKKEVLDVVFAVYEKLTAAPPQTPEDLKGLAVAYQNLANLLRDSGQPKEAEKAYARSLELLRKRAAEYPAVAGCRVDLAHGCRLSVGWLQGPDKDKKSAPLLRESITLFESLATEFPDVPFHRLYAASSHEWLGGILVILKLPKQGEEHYRKAIELLTALPTDYLAKSDARVAADNAFNGLANLLRAGGRKNEAENLIRQAIDFYNKLAASQPNELSFKQELAKQCVNMAELFQSMGQAGEAQRFAVRTVESMARVTGDEGATPEVRHDQAMDCRNLALRLQAAGQPDQAEALCRVSRDILRRLTAEFPSRPGVGRLMEKDHTWDLGHTNRFLAAMMSPDRAQEQLVLFQEAAEIFGKLFADHPDDSGTLHFQADTHRRIGSLLANMKRYDEAEKAYRRAVQLFHQLPGGKWRPGTHRNAEEEVAGSMDLVNFLLAQKRPDDADEVARQAIAFYAKFPREAAYRDAVARSHHTLAEILAQKKQPQEAIKEYRAAIAGWEKLTVDFRDKPEFLTHTAWSYNHLAAVLIASKQPDEAEKAYRHAIAVWAKLADRHHVAYSSDLLGFLLNSRGKFGQAAQAFRQAVSVWHKLHTDSRKDDYRKYESLSHEWLFEVLLAQAGQIEKDVTLPDGDRRDKAQACRTEAKELARDGLKQGLQTPTSLNNMAWRLATDTNPANRDPALAIELAKLAVEREPKQGMWRNTLGAAQYRARDWKAAIEAMNKSIELRNGGDSFDWFFLAMAHWQLGEKENARKWYDQAVQWMDKNQPKNEELRRFRTEAEGLLKAKE